MILINKFENFTNFDYKGLSQTLLSLTPTEMAALAGIVGTICTISLTSAELNILGNFLEAVGQIILVAQAQASNQTQQNQVPSTDFIAFQKEINYKLNYLYQLLNIKIK